MVYLNIKKTAGKFLLIQLMLLLLFVQCEKDVINTQIEIPDESFLNALIEQGVDINGDSIISRSEAESITSLWVESRGISDLTGIEGFINLDTLGCRDNQLNSLDVTGNAVLRYLDCTYNSLSTLSVSTNSVLEVLDCRINGLTSIDVSNNLALKYLWCGYNHLAIIDVSKNTSLEGLECSYMNIPITSLDLSHNTALKWLYCEASQLSLLDVSNQNDLAELECSGNELSTLDISNNTALEWLKLSNMLSLNEVCVWIIPFPPEGIHLDTTLSPNVYFTTECSE